MKQNITLLAAALLALSACGSSAQIAGGQFQDGIYYRHNAAQIQQITAADAEVQQLVDETQGSEIYIASGQRDTVVVPKGKAAKVTFRDEGSATVTVYDNDLFLGYSPWHYSSWYYDPWVYSSWYWGASPWYYNGWHSWHYRPWYYSSWYWDPWYYDSWAYRSWYYDPWYYSGWYSPYYYYCFLPYIIHSLIRASRKYREKGQTYGNHL